VSIILLLLLLLYTPRAKEREKQKKTTKQTNNNNNKYQKRVPIARPPQFFVCPQQWTMLWAPAAAPGLIGPPQFPVRK